jgi:hypothetical protein
VRLCRRLTLEKTSLLELVPGNTVVIRDEVGWTPRYRLGVVEKVRLGVIRLTGGDEYNPATGKAKNRYASQQQLFLPTEKVRIVWAEGFVTAREAVDLCADREVELQLQTEYTRYILDIGYNKLIKMNVAVLKQVAELLGYKPIGG